MWRDIPRDMRDLRIEFLGRGSYTRETVLKLKFFAAWIAHRLKQAAQNPHLVLVERGWPTHGKEVPILWHLVSCLDSFGLMGEAIYATRCISWADCGLAKLRSQERNRLVRKERRHRS